MKGTVIPFIVEATIISIIATKTIFKSLEKRMEQEIRGRIEIVRL